jgi:Ca2+-binding RTX toxin-like protein
MFQDSANSIHMLEVSYGTAGNDAISGNGLLLGGGYDTLTGGMGADVLRGNDGDDSLVGGFGNDVLKSEEGNNILDRNAWFGATVDLSDTSGNTGEAAGDTFIDVNGAWGSGHHDTLVGNAYANWIIADGGNDLVQGLAGSDTLYGSTGHDTLNGGGDDDALWGNAGADRLLGGDGHDALRGEDGDDTLDGGAGTDQLMGGAGRDVFVTDAGGSPDQFIDFTAGEERSSFRAACSGSARGRCRRRRSGRPGWRSQAIRRSCTTGARAMFGTTRTARARGLRSSWR